MYSNNVTNHSSLETIIHIDDDFPQSYNATPDTREGIQVAQLAEDMRLQTTSPDFKLVSLTAAFSLGKPLVLENLQGDFVVGALPGDDRLRQEDVQALINSGEKYTFHSDR